MHPRLLGYDKTGAARSRGCLPGLMSSVQLNLEGGSDSAESAESWVGSGAAPSADFRDAGRAAEVAFPATSVNMRHTNRY